LNHKKGERHAHVCRPLAPGECIFCKLVKGEIPSAKVYEDDLTIAFMDIGQATRGHVLVASKRHAVNLLELTPEEAGAVMQTAQRVAAR
jgi:histidine triad (HIT) family protein